jgi:hypothetical protein
MTKFWRIQNTAQFEDGPSWDSYGCAEPSESADSDGWSGYWWAYHYHPGGYVDYSTLFLIQESDVEKARDGEQVDIYVPGLFGCKRSSGLLAYIEQIGGADDGMYVALYEGHEYPEYRADDGDVFGPVRLLAIYPAMEWQARAERGEFDEEDV